MKKISKTFGTFVYWLSWPVLFLILRGSKRTRAVIVVGSDVLLLKGRLGSNKWALPGGGIKSGEQPELSVLREIKEEVGLDISKSSLIYLGQQYYSEDGIGFDILLYGIRLTEKPSIKIQKKEISKYCWLPVDQINASNSNGDTRIALRTWNNTQ